MLTEFFDHLFRFGAILNLAWVIVFVSRSTVRIVHPQITIAMAITGICHLIVTAYDEVALFGPVLGAMLEFLARTVMGTIWLFCLSLFKDNFKLKPLHAFVLGLYIVRSLLFQMEMLPDEMFKSASFILRASIYIYLIYVILSEFSEDLLERRRTFRLWLTFAFILVPLIMTVVRGINGGIYQDRISLVDSVFAFLISCSILFQLIRVRVQYLFSPTSMNVKEPALSDTFNEENLLADDRYSLEVLEEKMREGLYREPGLTVARLAEVINIPEHRLRKLINQHLGHRNISQYLNNYRIEEAKERLADASQRQVSILMVAMELGYVSLRPFNRAFKNRTGHTPSNYRKGRLLESTKSFDNAPAVKN